MAIFQIISIPLMLALVALEIRLHVRDRQHGRVPGTSQPDEYTNWVASGGRWDWRDILWPRSSLD